MLKRVFGPGGPQPDRPCHKCGGKGTIPVVHVTANGKREWVPVADLSPEMRAKADADCTPFLEPCPVCRGSGKASAVVKK